MTILTLYYIVKIVNSLNTSPCALATPRPDSPGGASLGSHGAVPSQLEEEKPLSLFLAIAPFTSIRVPTAPGGTHF